MKKSKFFVLLLMAATISLVSCKKEDDGDNNNVNGGSMSLKHDGSSWSASLAVVATNQGGVLAITGSDSNANQCNITLMNVPGTGTYDIGGSMSNPNTGRWTAGLNQDDTYSTMLGQGTGTCTITELSANKVTGTFEFTAKNMSGVTVTISEGEFSANLTK